MSIESLKNRTGDLGGSLCVPEEFQFVRSLPDVQRESTSHHRERIGGAQYRESVILERPNISATIDDCGGDVSLIGTERESYIRDKIRTAENFPFASKFVNQFFGHSGRPSQWK